MSSSHAWGDYYEEPFERAEEYIETQYKAFTTDASQLPLIRTAALGSLAFGVKSYGEVVVHLEGRPLRTQGNRPRRIENTGHSELERPPDLYQKRTSSVEDCSEYPGGPERVHVV